MSVTGYGFVEVLYPMSSSWWGTTRVYFHGDVHVYAVLAFPWGDWEPGDDLPAPVAKPKGVPSDLSILATGEYARLVVEESELKGEGRSPERLITPAEVKERKCKPYRMGYVVDPEDWVCSTWLTLDEVALACKRYADHRDNTSLKPRSEELEGIRAMMAALEEHGPKKDGIHTLSRLVIWFD